MKKIRILMPILGIATITGAMMPLVSCSSNSKNVNVILSDTAVDLGFTIDKTNTAKNKEATFIITSLNLVITITH